ncbi:MAG: hypothetical protein CL431_09710 [Acidimicrobiaceae bacterium]|jgi:hypothetical protein|nr:hypothetical protein [Acidimicrobiaceae bacterium]|tara:strand:+ start:52702 stop:53208 length:507 start_codon:yes stop_codon:yes gene_type:complete
MTMQQSEVGRFLDKLRSHHFEECNYWIEARKLWEDSKLHKKYFGENLQIRDSNLSEIFSQFPQTRYLFMKEREGKRFETLPSIVNVFRGSQQSSIAGWSWTLNRQSAEQFARSNATDHRPLLAVVTGLPSESILALTEDLEGTELIIDPLTITLETAELSNIYFERIG